MAAWSPRRARQIAQHPVNPQPHAQPIRGGLQVDVAGARIVGVADEQAHEADDGHLVGQVADVGERSVRGLLGRVLAGVEVLDQLDHGL